MHVGKRVKGQSVPEHLESGIPRIRGNATIFE